MNNKRSFHSFRGIRALKERIFPSMIPSCVEIEINESTITDERRKDESMKEKKGKEKDGPNSPQHRFESDLGLI